MKISNELKVGTLTLIALIIGIAGFSFLKNKNILKPENKYNLYFKRVDNLLATNPVTISGMNIGSVEKIELERDANQKITGRVHVVISVKPDMPVHPQTIAQIQSTGLMGDKLIELQLPSNNTQKENQQIAPSGSTLQTNEEESITSQIEPFKTKLDTLITSINKMTNELNQILKSGAITNTLANIEKTTATLPQVGKQINGITQNLYQFTEKDLKTISNNLSGITNSADQTLKSVQSMSNSMQPKINKSLDNFEVITQNLKTTTQQLSKTHIDSTVNELNKTITQINGITTSINQNKGSLGMLINDKNLYNNLSGLSNNLQFLSTDLIENPKNYVSFSLFGKKQKTKEPSKDEPKK